MIVEGALYIFLCGVFGGFLGELLKWYRLRTSPRLPDYARSPFYWSVTVLVVVSGGILAVLYSVERMNAIMAANIGLTAPLLIQSMARSKIVSQAVSSEERELGPGWEPGHMLQMYVRKATKPSIWEFLSP